MNESGARSNREAIFTPENLCSLGAELVA